MCIGELGEEGRGAGGGGVAGTRECEPFVTNKNLQFNFPQAIRGVSSSIPYVSRSPSPAPFGCRRGWIPIMSTIPR